MSEARPQASRAARWIVTTLVVAGTAAFLLLRGQDGPQSDEPAQAEASAPPAAPAPGPRADAGAGVAALSELTPDASGKLTIPASRLASGEPVTVTLQLELEQIGDQPMTAELRSGGRTYAIGEAQLDRSTGVARLAIDAERLPAGQHLLAIRVADDSWNPHRRIAITVTPD